MTPAAIRKARLDAGLTLAQAAAIVDSSVRAWGTWEQGTRNMSPILWHCFRYWVDNRPAPPFSPRARED